MECFNFTATKNIPQANIRNKSKEKLLNFIQILSLLIQKRFSAHNYSHQIVRMLISMCTLENITTLQALQQDNDEYLNY